MENNLTIIYMSALRKRYEAQIEEAKANLALYLSSANLAAIGEHSDLLTEHDRWIEQLANAKDKLETLDSIFDFTNMRLKI
jgi:outer membrane usher protein FimD/PapC